MTDEAREAPPRTLRAAARSFFRFGSPRLLAAQLLAAATVRPLLGGFGTKDLVVLGAVAAYWPIQEWVLHKYALHSRPIRIFGREIELPPARAHRCHHESPTDPQAALLPGATIAMLIPVNIALWSTIAPTWGVACTGIAALGGAALLYEWIHFLTHTAYKPKSAWFATVKKQHMWHHHRDDKRWFGFVVPKLDDWLGTGGAGASARPQGHERAPVATDAE